MPIRKRMLHRECIKCGKLFEPTGKTNRVCKKCSPRNRFINKMIKVQKKAKKKCQQ